MYETPSNYDFDDYRAPITTPANYSFIRILHASPDTSAVDIYANGKILARNVSYKGFSPYIKVPAGIYNVKVFHTGKTVNPLVNASLDIPPVSIFTIAAIGKSPSVSLYPILEPLHSGNPGFAMVRFVHLAPTAPSVDVSLPGGKKLFKDVEYKEVTGYIPVKPGTYTFQARPTGSDKVILVTPNIRFVPNRLYSVYAVGIPDGTPPLQILIPMDGGTYLKFKK